MSRIELFETSTRILSAGRVPELDERQLEAARKSFLAAIRAESASQRTFDEPAA